MSRLIIRLLLGGVLALTIASPALAAIDYGSSSLTTSRTTSTATTTTNVTVHRSQLPLNICILLRIRLGFGTSCTQTVSTTTTIHKLPVRRVASSGEFTLDSASCPWTSYGAQEMRLVGVTYEADVHASLYLSSVCGRVMWTSVTCRVFFTILTSVHWNWCGAWPNVWISYYYTDTNWGFDYTVSYLLYGFPLSVDKGGRIWINPYNGRNYSYTY